jgi:uncharacterized protein
VPMAFFGAYLLHLIAGNSAAQSETAQTNVELALGIALLVGASAMVLRYVLDWRSGKERTVGIAQITPRPLLTIAVGMVGGVIVGITSVGSGSLMIVMLLFLYPLLSAGQLVGTDLTQAVPLTAAAALGALAFGHVEFAVTTSIVLGSIPAVLVGSFLSSRAPDKVIRPAITFVIFASGLKYVGVGTTALGWILCSVLLGAFVAYFGVVRPWRNGRAAAPDGQADGKPDGQVVGGLTLGTLAMRGAGEVGGVTGGARPGGLGEDRVVAADGLEAADGDHVGEHG